MGSGTFPLIIGAILALLGLGIFIPGFFAEGKKAGIDVKSIVSITGAVGLFAIVIERFGFIPAIFSMTIVAILAKGWRGWRFAVLLSAAMCALGTIVFYYGLSMPLHLFDWPR